MSIILWLCLQNILFKTFMYKMFKIKGYVLVVLSHFGKFKERLLSFLTAVENNKLLNVCPSHLPTCSLRTTFSKLKFKIASVFNTYVS